MHYSQAKELLREIGQGINQCSIAGPSKFPTNDNTLIVQLREDNRRLSTENARLRKERNDALGM